MFMSRAFLKIYNFFYKNKNNYCKKNKSMIYYTSLWKIFCAVSLFGFIFPFYLLLMTPQKSGKKKAKKPPVL